MGKKNVSIITLGCQMNVRDSEVVAGLLKQAGYSLTDEEDNADIVIFNTCSVRQHAEDKVWSEIGKIAKKTQNAKRKTQSENKRPLIGLIGCMAQNYKEKVFQRSPAIDFAAGPADIDKIPDIIAALVKTPGAKPGSSSLFERKIWETDGESRPEEIYHTGHYQEKDHAFVVISEGCSNFCSYCVVPYVRGPLRNRAAGNIIREIEEGIKKGIRKFTLLGQNVNAYKSEKREARNEKRDNGEREIDFMALLGMVNAVKGLQEFGFITSHPRDTSEGLFKAMAGCDKLRKYLHLPVQSGSDRILEKMNRGYSARFYLELAEKYRTIVPGGLLSTDIIVGFPGETEEDFQRTFELVKTVGFDSAYIFKYSPRPHSAASSWPDDIPQAEKERRHQLILQAQKKISRERKGSSHGTKTSTAR